MKHMIAVDDWVWDWACKKYGVKNPASELRAMINERVANEKNLSVGPNGDKQQEATAFIAKRTSICPHCRKTLREGQAAVASQGKWLHAECYDQIVESGS